MVTSAVQQKTTPSSRSEELPIAPWPYFAADEIEAVSAVLGSGKVKAWTGQEGRQFEVEFAHYVEAKYGICVANGTVALELAIHALGIGPGDEVITTSRTFVASASCVVMRGARPVLDEWESIYRSFTQGPAQLGYAEGGAS
jgi:dTDP-4-amino-4,6-dideoxygalactose transaminase